MLPLSVLGLVLNPPLPGLGEWVESDVHHVGDSGHVVGLRPALATFPEPNGRDRHSGEQGNGPQGGLAWPLGSQSPEAKRIHVAPLPKRHHAPLRRSRAARRPIWTYAWDRAPQGG